MSGALAAVAAMLVLRMVLHGLEQVRDEAAARPAREGDPSVAVSAILVATLGVVGLVWSVRGAVWAVPLLASAVLFAEPWFLARAVAIPLGWSRVAFWLTRFSTLTWTDDRRGAARVAAAWAAARGRARDAAAHPWVPPPDGDERPLTASALAAAGLAAAASGDRGEARRLLAATEDFDRRPYPLRRVVSEWRAAEAATRGDWDAVARIAGEAYRPTPATVALGMAAERLLDLPEAPDATAFAAAWRRAPALHANGADLFHRALAARHRPAPDPRSGGGLAGVLAAHARASASPAEVPEAARRWADVGPTDALRGQVVEDLADLADRGPVRVADLAEGLGPEIADVVRERRLGRLEAAVSALRDRVRAGRGLDPLGEAREWLAIRELYQRLVAFGGPEVARVAFHVMFAALTDLAADLYNARGQPYLFRAITRWLLAEAERVGDERATELLRHNLEVSRAWG